MLYIHSIIEISQIKFYRGSDYIIVDVEIY